jgi:hypothetical protein
MAQDSDELDGLILQAVSNDYEPLESIVSQLSDRSGGVPEKAGIVEIERRLLSLIADGFVAPWLIHAEAPYITVSISYETVRSSWFYITEKGMKCLRRRMRNPRCSESSERDPGAPYFPSG